MIVDETHRALHFAAQETCLSLTNADVAALGERARVALVQLAIYAGCTHVEWWPAWADLASEKDPR